MPPTKTAIPTSHRFTGDERTQIEQKLRAAAAALIEENMADMLADIEATALDKTPDADAVVTIAQKLTVNYDQKDRTVTVDAKLDWKREVKHSQEAETEVIDLKQLHLPGVDD